MLNQYIVTQGICTITTCISFRTRHNSQGCFHQFLYQLSHFWDRLPPERDLLSHYWDYLSPEGGLLSHCWDYLSPEGGFLSHFLDCLSPKGVSCLIAGIICISRRFLVPLLIYLSPDEGFLSHFPDCWSPEGSFLSHCLDYLSLRKEVFCPISGLFVSRKRLFVSFLDSLSPERGFLSHFWTLCLPKEVFFPIAGTICFPKEVFLSHCWDYLSPEGGFFCHKQKYTKTKAVSHKAGTKFL